MLKGKSITLRPVRETGLDQLPHPFPRLLSTNYRFP